MAWWLLGAACAAALALCLWCLALLPRRGRLEWEQLGRYRYAHRGLHDRAAGRPENSLSAFRAAAEAGFGAELDVHLMADGSLAVVHDADLARVCGKHAVIEQLRREDLADYPLLDGAGQTVPLLEQVLDLFEGRAPLIIELKAQRGNAAALTAAVKERLEQWQGAYCLESFDPTVLRELKKRWPQPIRGQLSRNFLRGEEHTGYGALADWAMTHLLICFAGRPDFVAYHFPERREPSLRLQKKIYGVHEVCWTVRDRETMRRLEKQGATVIFEKFVPESPFREENRG